MTGQHRNPDPPPRARWLPWGIGAVIAVLVPSAIAMYVGDALSVTAGEPTPAPTMPTRTTAPAVSFHAPAFPTPDIPSIGAEGHWTPPVETTQATTTAAKPSERRSAPREVAPGSTDTPRNAPRASEPVSAPPPVAAAEPIPEPPTEPQQQPNITSGLLTLVNPARTEAGCLPLTEDPELNDYARNWSATQAAAGTMSHSGGPYAENVAYGYETAAAVFEGWMTSPGHRNNVLECSWTRHGIGAATSSDGRIYWTQVFST